LPGFAGTIDADDDQSASHVRILACAGSSPDLLSVPDGGTDDQSDQGA
jgi:hypothetical protein